MIFVFLVILLVLDLYFVFMRDVFNLTKYDDEKIINRFFLKKKKISKAGIKQLYIVDKCIIVVEKEFD